MYIIMGFAGYRLKNTIMPSNVNVRRLCTVVSHRSILSSKPIGYRPVLIKLFECSCLVTTRPILGCVEEAGSWNTVFCCLNVDCNWMSTLLTEATIFLMHKLRWLCWYAQLAFYVCRSVLGMWEIADFLFHAKHYEWLLINICGSCMVSKRPHKATVDCSYNVFVLGESCFQWSKKIQMNNGATVPCIRCLQ